MQPKNTTTRHNNKAPLAGSYVEVKKKNYEKNGFKRTMVQLVDVTQSIRMEQVNAENQFLAITNATVSHELRNPLQSITCQTLRISLCLKEILAVIKQDGRQDTLTQQIGA